MKKLMALVAAVPVVTFADTVVISDEHTVVREAAIRESIRQDTTWTSENIQANPYLFLQDQIRNCDQLKNKIEAQNITLVRMGKESQRKIDDAESMINRYNRFLEAAKVAYKAAEESGKWPANVNGNDMDEEELGDRIADALERVELAEKEKVTNAAIIKKVNIRKGVLKSKKRELVTLRRNLAQQAEQVKMNAALAEMSSLNDALGIIKDMMLELEEDPVRLTIDDLTAEDPNAKRNSKIRAFLDK